MKVYIAGPLFNEMELSRNKEIKNFISSVGVDTYLPQEDAGIIFDLSTEETVASVKKDIFGKDIQAMKDCDVLVALLDGRTVDEGLCFEVGYAYALGKKCIGYKTDSRTLNKYGDNPMIECSLEATFNSKESLVEYLLKIKN